MSHKTDKEKLPAAITCAVHRCSALAHLGDLHSLTIPIQLLHVLIHKRYKLIWLLLLANECDSVSEPMIF